MLLIRSFIIGKWKENCYVISNESHEGVIIDPGGQSSELQKYLIETNIRPLAILNTHAHYDHIGAVSYLKTQWNIPFFLHSKDVKLLNQANFYRKLFDGTENIIIPTVDSFFDCLSKPFRIGNFEIATLDTPGHTHGGVCIRLNEHLFTGDTLLNGEIGRVDLPGGNLAMLKNSLKTLGSLAHSILIYPGHGQSSTIGKEVQDNPQFREALE